MINPLMKIKNLYNHPIARKLAIIIASALGLTACLQIAWQLRFDFSVPENTRHMVWVTTFWIIPLKLILLAFLRQYSGLLSYFSVRDLARLFAAITGSSSIIMVLWFVVADTSVFLPPRGVILTDYVLSFMGLASIRLAVRLHREKTRDLGNRHNTKKYNVGIVGAGHSGANLAKDLFLRKELGFELKCFFDDNPEKCKSPPARNPHSRQTRNSIRHRFQS